MRQEIIMPRMGQSMDEGRVLQWLVKIGDEIKQGEFVAEIETDKAVVEIESFVTGTLVEIVAAEGELVPTGAAIALVEDGQPEVKGKAKIEPAPEEKPIPIRAAAAGNIPRDPQPTVPINASPVAKRLAKEHDIDLALIQGNGPGGRIGKEDVESYLVQKTAEPPKRINASPLAKQLAKERGIDLAQVKGTGPGGRIGKDDVEAWIEGRAPGKKETGPETVDDPLLSKIKMTTARRMSESKRTAPHFYVTCDIELDRALALRDWYKNQGQEISINDLILKATAMALSQFPALNATFIDDKIRRYSSIDLAVAVALDEGLITPVIHHCERLSLVEIARATRGAIERARAGKLSPDDLADGTFTVSNLGMYRVRQFEAIINPPQAAILAVGAVRKTPVYDAHDQLVPRRVITATVSADHRVTDGAEVARFLQQVRAILENGFDLMTAGKIEITGS